jgi:hypothetical protein
MEMSEEVDVRRVKNVDQDPHDARRLLCLALEKVPLKLLQENRLSGSHALLRRKHTETGGGCLSPSRHSIGLATHSRDKLLQRLLVSHLSP